MAFTTVGELVATHRAAMRPRWSQQFLADELTRCGYPATRTQIARLENSLPTKHHSALLAAAALVLRIPNAAMIDAMTRDYATVQQRVAAIVTRPPRGVSVRRAPQ